LRVKPGKWAAAALTGLSADIGIKGGGGRPSMGPALPATSVSLGPGLADQDIRGVLGLLAQLGKSSVDAGATPEPVMFQQRLSTMPVRSQTLLYQALATLAAQAPTDRPDQPMLLKLAEHVAIRFALESFERGEVRVNAVREMLDGLNKEIDTLRKILGHHEEKLARSGVQFESHSALLAQYFWAEVSEEEKEKALLSAEASCVPPVNIRQYVENLLDAGKPEKAHAVLRNFVSCISRPEASARRDTAIGLADLADLYACDDGQLLLEAIRKTGEQLAVESEPELHSMVSAAFVRLSQTAATQRSYPAMLQAMGSVDGIEAQRPGMGQSLRPRIGVENRLPEFIEEALRAEKIPAGLAELMQKMPQVAAESLTSRFGRSGFREDCNLLLEMATRLGPVGIQHLRESLSTAQPAAAVETVGLLSRLEPSALEEILPVKMKEWQRSIHDRVVRQIAAAATPHRAILMLLLFDSLDPLVKPLALDEIGMSGDTASVPRLLRLAEGDLPPGSTPYLRVKAIEALGRLRAADAVPLLRKIVETKQMWRWANTGELRIAAAQSLQKIDPEGARDILARSGLEASELALGIPDEEQMSSCIRQRRYPRMKLSQPLPAVTTNLRENYRLEVPIMNLGGGIATCERYLTPGTLVALKFNPSLRSIRAQTFVRDARGQTMGFEVVDIDLDERGRLRRVLAELGGTAQTASPKSRSRRRDRAPAAKPQG
jgi:hypothetical protein